MGKTWHHQNLKWHRLETLRLPHASQATKSPSKQWKPNLLRSNPSAAAQMMIRLSKKGFALNLVKVWAQMVAPIKINDCSWPVCLVAVRPIVGVLRVLG